MSRIPRPSNAWLGWFRRYADRYLAKHFHAVRLAKGGRPAAVPSERPLVVYLNHPSWWDPLIGLHLAFRFFPERQHFAPIEAKALERYKLLGKLGFFGVDVGSRQGAREFSETARAILAVPRSTIWITPAGRFTDPRERPIELRSGLGHLAARVRPATFLPLAVEYPFWDERTPEALARFGEPIDSADADLAPNAWTELLAARLLAAQDALAEGARTRDPKRFEVLLGGEAGVGGTYDLFRRLRARLGGKTFRAAHGDPEGDD